MDFSRLTGLREQVPEWVEPVPPGRLEPFECLRVIALPVPQQGRRFSGQR